MYKIEEKFKNFVQLLLLAIIYPIFKWWITSKQIWNTCFKGNISTNLTRKSTATETIHLIPLISPQKVGKEGGGGKRSHFSRETNATMVHPPPFQTISISHPTPVHSTPPPPSSATTLPLSQLVSSASRLPFPRRIPRSTGLDSRAKHTDIGREGAPTG